MFKKLIPLCTVILGLAREGQTLGTSCEGDLSHSVQSQFWLNNVQHGHAFFNKNPDTYPVYRNIKDYGAVGDGIKDDSHAINLAISEGDRCRPGCASSTVSPAIIYFPPGKYLIGRPLLQYYYTQFIGDAIDVPTLIMAPNFDGGIGLITSDESEIWISQNNFYRQVRNFIIDLTQVVTNKTAAAIHWQVAQATSLNNIHIKMSSYLHHQGIRMENGSGGFMSDLTFEGGEFGLWVGNQQFTSRNLTIRNANTAIYLNWAWGWSFKGLIIEGCGTGLDMTAGGEVSERVGSALVMDAVIRNTTVGVLTATSTTSKPSSAGALILDNVLFNNVDSSVQHSNGQILVEGGKQIKIDSWGQGHFYERSGEHGFRQGTLTAPTKSAVLLDNSGYFFEKSKPTYTDIALEDFINVLNEGAKGDGITDDTEAIRWAINKYAGCKIIYFPMGYYIVTDTIYVPPGSRIIGEIWSTILVKGEKFGDQNNPIPVFQVGNAGEQGIAEISEMIFSTAGPVPGAIIIQINMKESEQGSVGLWDVHFRIGGAKGTDLQTLNCPKGGAQSGQCMGAYLMLHITQTGSAYLENVWAWVADHDLDGDNQINVYNGRGVLVESTDGPVWMYGTASEHSVMYQYNFANTKNILVAMIQSETAYYQAYPPAPEPFHTEARYNDPDYSSCAAGSVTCPMGYGLIMRNSKNIYVYGAGLYNFFQNYDQGYLDSEYCQDTMVTIEQSNQNVYIYNLNTKAADTMVMVDGKPIVKQIDNRSTFCSTIAALFP